MTISIRSVVCTCCAFSFLGLATIAESAPLSVLSYTYSAGNNPASNSNTNSAYQDNGDSPGTGFDNTELTDGLFPTVGVGTTFLDNRWVGTQNSTDDLQPQPEITFDFGAKYQLNNFTVIYDVDHSPNIFAPDNVSVSFSNDGVLYSTPVSLTGFDDSSSSQITVSTTLNFPANSIGRYARLAFYNDEEWTFIAEISFDGEEPPPIPEPSSMFLLGCGVLGLVQVTKRKK